MAKLHLWICLLLAACAAPDISAFKQSSIALTTGLNENQATLVSEGEKISAKLGNPSGFTNKLKRLKKQGAQVQILSSTLASYANSVARLARAGTDGEEAVNELVGDISTTVQSFTGAAADIPASVSDFTAALGRIQQISKNKQLYEIMQSVEEHIYAVADALADEPKGEIGIIQGMARNWSALRPDLTAYHQSAILLKKKTQNQATLKATNLQTRIANCQAAAPCDYEQLLKDHRTEIAAMDEAQSHIQILLNEIDPYEQAYASFENKIELWEGDMLAKIGGIPELATAWKNDHKMVMNYLKDCTKFGGTFKKKCGAFSAGNLELFGSLLGKAALGF